MACDDDARGVSPTACCQPTALHSIAFSHSFPLPQMPLNLTRLYSPFADDGFYQFWLVAFSILCLALLAVERCMTGRDKCKESADDRLESARPAGSGSALGVLASKYLVVYAIVMGRLDAYSSSRGLYSPSAWHQLRTGCRARTYTHYIANSMDLLRGSSRCSS
jgi:hypothetical protein